MSNKSFPIMIIIFMVIFILCVFLYKNHKKLKEKYNIGYLSSFLFTAYMLSPLILGVLAILENERKFPLIISLIYPMIGISIFLFLYRDKTWEYKKGKFFAMIGVGLCASLLFILKMLTFFHNFETERSTSQNAVSYNRSSSKKIKNKEIRGTDGKSKGYINNDGEKYSDNGTFQWRINDDGEIYSLDGYYGRINGDGEIYDKHGVYCGRINEEGEIYDKDGRSSGYLSNG